MKTKELLEHSDFVRALARSLVLDEHRADDIEQQTWLAALENPPVIRKSLRSWLSQVTRNFARIAYRRESRRSRHENASVHRTKYLSPEEIASREEMVRFMTDAVFKLKEPFRTTIVLRFYDNLSINEIAKRAEVPAGTIKSRLVGSPRGALW